MDEVEKIMYGQMIHDTLVLANYSADEAIDVMADKGNSEASTAASLISIAKSLVAIGFMEYEKRR